MHQDFAVLLNSLLVNPLDTEGVHAIIKEAVEIEKEFIEYVLQHALVEMNKEKMMTYIEYMADRLLVQLGHSKIWNSKQPFDFMDMLSIENKTLFFEKRVAEYAKVIGGEDKITFDEDF